MDKASFRFAVRKAFFVLLFFGDCATESVAVYDFIHSSKLSLKIKATKFVVPTCENDVLGRFLKTQEPERNDIWVM